jgi:hypothetical protein
MCDYVTIRRLLPEFLNGLVPSVLDTATDMMYNPHTSCEEVYIIGHDS